MSDTVRVLVVEDEALIVSFVEAALSDGGFEACSVGGGPLHVFAMAARDVGSC